MDKVEYKLRSEEIKKLIQQKDYAQAADIADTIDWRRVKSVMMLCTISDVYKINRRYENAKDLLLLAYDRRPGGRSIVYSLCELCLRTGDLVHAMEYYKEFVNVAPKDPGRYILQYKIYEDQDVSLEERIEVLEELKKHDYTEKWAYELAYLYHRVGLATRCVEECDEMIACFGDGDYVIKAMELKMLHQPLSADQQNVYDHRFDPKQEDDFLDEDEDEEDSVSDDGQVSHGDFGIGDVIEPDGNTAVWKKEAVEQSLVTGDTIVYEPVRPEDLAGMGEIGTEDDMPVEMKESEATEEPEEDEEFVPREIKVNAEEDEPEIFVKPINVGEYNTIDLQAALAEELKPYLDDENDMDDGEDPADESGDSAEKSEEADDLFTEDTDISEEPEEDAESDISGFSEGTLTEEEPAYDEVEDSEVFFGETGEINMSRYAAQPSEDPYEAKMAEIEPPREMANVLSQESDGQLRIVLPQGNAVEKQITGQMDIQDVLAEWERMKKENEEKRREEVRRHVLQQTGSMFTEFEAAVRDGLLEKLEKENSTVESAVQSDEDIFTDLTVEDLFGEADELGEIQGLEDIEDNTAEESIELEGFAEPETGEEVEATEEPEEEAEEEAEAAEEPEEEAEEEAEAAEEPEEESEEEAEAAEEPEEESGEEAEAAEEPEEESGEEAEEAEEPEEEAEEETEAAEEPEEEAGEEAEEAEESAETETAEEAEEEIEAEAEPEDTAKVKLAKEKVRPMTREEREHFSAYIQSRETREQIVKTIDNISLAAYTGNVIVTGEVDVDTIPLAKRIIREIQANDSNFSGQVAKISGHGLSQKSMDETIEKLQNGALIVQSASTMDEQTITDLHKALQRENLGIVVILQDDTKSMDAFLEQHSFLLEEFSSRIDVKALSNDSLVNYGRQYAKEQECSIDEMGVLALHNRIEKRQSIDHAVTIAEVRDIVDQAIRHAKRFSLGHYCSILVGKRYDEEDMIIVTEKDFV